MMRQGREPTLCSCSFCHWRHALFHQRRNHQVQSPILDDGWGTLLAFGFCHFLQHLQADYIPGCWARPSQKQYSLISVVFHGLLFQFTTIRQDTAQQGLTLLFHGPTPHYFHIHYRKNYSKCFFFSPRWGGSKVPCIVCSSLSVKRNFVFAGGLFLFHAYNNAHCEEFFFSCSLGHL